MTTNNAAAAGGTVPDGVVVTTANDEPEVVDWGVLVRPYVKPDAKRSIWQLTTTFALLVAVEAGAWFLSRYSIFFAIGIDVIAAGLLVRLFIFQHDCGHGSFFKNQRVADVIGTLIGFLTLTPYFAWRHAHAIHHATTGNLSRRTIGDIETVTVAEYLAMPRLRRLRYRLYRNPIIMFLFGSFYVFVIAQRFAKMFEVPGRDIGPRERRSVHLTTACGLLVFLALFIVGGWRLAFLVHGLSLALSAAVGVFLFYIQHQFEDAYWQPQEDWVFSRAAMEGASCLRLPLILRFFTGNIGIHHVHHLAPRIPNYELRRALRENEILRDAPTIGLRDAFRAVALKLYDEQTRKMITWRDLRARARHTSSMAPQ